MKMEPQRVFARVRVRVFVCEAIHTLRGGGGDEEEEERPVHRSRVRVMPV